MPLKSVRLTLSQRGRKPVPNLPNGYNAKFALLEGALREAIGDDPAWELSLQAGSWNETSAGAIREGNPADEGIGRWVAANTGIVRVSDPSKLGGRKRFVTGNQSPGGIRGALASPPSGWTGLTIILPDVSFNTLLTINTLFSVGTTAATRLTLYLNGNGYLVYNHGTGGNTLTANTKVHAVDTRYSIMITYNAATGEVKFYSSSATPIFTGTMTQGATPATAGGVFGTAYDALTSSVDGSQVIVASKDLSAKAGAIMAACANMRSFAG